VIGLPRDRRPGDWLPKAASLAHASQHQLGSEAFWLRTSDPQRALNNLLARDEIFTAEIAAAAARNNLPTIRIDRDRDADAITAAIADHFGL